MKLKNYNGSIKTVSEVIAAVEFRHTFNGSKRRLLEPCKDGSVKPNALVFAFDDRVQPMGVFQPFGGGCEDRLVLGNLAAEKAEEIITSLLKEGYADISGIKLQKHQYALDKYVMDDGKSDAYAFSTSCPNLIFTNTANGIVDIFNPNGVAVDGDAEDGEEFGEDC